MAVTTNPPPKPHHNNHHHNLLHSIPIDMSTFSHSELHSLSLLTSPSTTTTVTTTSTTTHFSINPSLSTHQQTYSLSPHHPRRHLFNQERSESNLIVSFLRNHLHHPKTMMVNNFSVEIVNTNGVVVDLAALEESEVDGGPFGPHLRKMANGRVEEEELLQILADIDGEWCSRRKKRRVIDACLLGDALPVGWKVIVALRRKGGHFSPYCRRYISPTGEQFLSCKEVSSYLKSYFGIHDAKLVRDSRAERQTLRTADSVDNMCTNSGDGNSMLNLSDSTMPIMCVPVEHQEASIFGIDELSDVPVRDLYECHSCNLTFDEKDKYLQHVVLLHQKTTRRYTLDSSVEDKVIVKDRVTVKEKVIFKDKEPESKKRKRKRKLGSSVGDGVIIRDGNFECQFCHKVFEERRRYLGHVGNHVKGSIKSSKDSDIQTIKRAKSPCFDRSPSMINISKMDALIEIAQNSIQDYNMLVIEKEPTTVNKVDQLNVAKDLQSMDVDLETEHISSSPLNEADNGNCLGKDKTPSTESHPCETASRISGICPVKEKHLGVCELFIEELHPHLSPDKATEISVTDKNENYVVDSPGEYGGEDTSKEKCLPLELYTQGMMGEISNIGGSTDDPFSCPIEREPEKFVGEDETVPRDLNPLLTMSKKSTTNVETLTCNIVNIEKGSSSEATMIPAAESVSVRCKSTTAEGEESLDEPVQAFSIHQLQHSGKVSDLDSSADMIQSDYVHKREPESALKYDGNELATVFSKSHASVCAVPHISLNSSSSFDEIFEKAGQNICNLDQNLESITGLEYMKLDVTEPQMYKYSGMSREDSISFYEVSMDMGNTMGLELGLDNSFKSQSDFTQEMTAKCLTTTVCVWCGVEFSHEIGDVEPQPDSVGFMCPSCRAKISKQFNELESNFPEFSLF